MNSPWMEAEAKLEIAGNYTHLKFPSKRQMSMLRHLSREDPWLATRMLGKGKPIKYIVDAGACIGATALMFHRAFPEARILALEPVSVNYDYLVYNTKDFQQITPSRMGVYDKRTSLKFAMPSPRQRVDQTYMVGNTGLFSIYGEGEHSEIAPVDRLDDIVDGPVDLLKLDVEGAEALALKGAERIMAEDRPIVFMEMREEHCRMSGCGREFYENYYTELGYTVIGEYFSDPVLAPIELGQPQTCE